MDQSLNRIWVDIIDTELYMYSEFYDCDESQMESWKVFQIKKGKHPVVSHST